MPRVGSKHYSYSPNGIKAAKAEAKKTGKKMVVARGMKIKMDKGGY